MVSCIIWFFTALSFFFLELTSPGLLFCLAFSCGALLACALAFIWEDDLLLQTVSFLLGTLIAYIVLYVWIKQDTHHGYKSNSDALIGKQGILIAAISPGNPGSVKIGGEIWMALSVHNQPVASQTPVQVVSIKGVHLIVSPISHLT